MALAVWALVRAGVEQHLQQLIFGAAPHMRPRNAGFMNLHSSRYYYQNMLEENPYCKTVDLRKPNNSRRGNTTRKNRSDFDTSSSCAAWAYVSFVRRNLDRG